MASKSLTKRWERNEVGDLMAVVKALLEGEALGHPHWRIRRVNNALIGFGQHGLPSEEYNMCGHETCGGSTYATDLHYDFTIYV